MNIRKVLYSWHRWLGIHLSLLIFALCVTGTFAVLGHEWDWLFDEAWRADSTEVAWSKIGETLKDEFPNHGVIHVAAPVAQGFAATAMLQAQNQQIQMALFEPETGALSAVRNPLTVQVFLRQFHKRFLIPKGVYFTGLLSIALLFSVISGLWIYRHFWKYLFRFRIRESANRRWTDLHRTTGVWVSLFGLIIAITGVWYLVELAGHDLQIEVDDDDPVLSSQRLATLSSDSKPMPIEDVVVAAEAALPGLEVRNVRMPRKPDAPYRVEGQIGSLLVRDRSSRVYLDPYNLEVLGIQRADELGPVHRWSDMADELHFGTLGASGGLWSKILYFVFGLLLSFAVLAGPILSMQRKRSKRGKKVRNRDMAMGLVTGLVVAATLPLAYTGYNLTLVQGRETPTASTPEFEIGGHMATIVRHPGDEQVAYILRWSNEPPPNLESATLEAGGKSVEFEGWHILKGFAPRALQLSVEIRWLDGEVTTVETTMKKAYVGSEDELSPELYVHVFMSIVFFVFIAGTVLWIRWLWLPLVRNLSD